MRKILWRKLSFLSLRHNIQVWEIIKTVWIIYDVYVWPLGLLYQLRLRLVPINIFLKKKWKLDGKSVEFSTYWMKRGKWDIWDQCRVEPLWRGGVTLLSRFHFDAFPSVPGGPEQWENGQMNTVSQWASDSPHTGPPRTSPRGSVLRKSPLELVTNN